MKNTKRLATPQPWLPRDLEVHEHTVLNSQRSPAPRIVHSHEGGSTPHQHLSTGPATYGKVGNGKPDEKPRGPQLPRVELEDWQKSFEIIVCNPSPSKGQPGYIGEGPGLLPAERLVNTYRMTISAVRDGRNHGS